MEGFRKQKRPEDIVVDMVTVKFGDINTNINKIFAWQERAEVRIKAVEEGFAHLKSEFHAIQYEIIGKAHEYDDTIQDFRSSIQAFDRLLSRLSPLVAKSVNDLHITSEYLKEKNPDIMSAR